MAFLSPLFLVGAAAALVPIVLHLLKRHPERRVRFAAVRFLRAAPVEHASGRRLREWLLLMLRVAALLLLALTFARPFIRSAAAHAAAGTTVVALDTSFSMSAPGRFDRARALAKDAVRSASSGDDVAVVTFSDQADVAVRPTSDRAAALVAIDAARPGFGSTRYRGGLNTAGSLVAGQRASIVVVTDLQESGWDAGDHASVPEGTRIEVRDVGALPDNVAIIGLRVDGDRAIATIRNDGSRGRQVRARLSVDGRAVAETSVAVGARESAEAVFANLRGPRDAAGSTVAVGIDDPEGIQADDVRYALMSGAGRPAVLVVTATGNPAQDAFYLEHALVAGRSGDQPDVTGMSASKLSGLSQDQLRRHAVVVLLSTRGLEPRGREALASYVASGGGVLMAAGPDVDGSIAADVLGAGARLKVAPIERAAAGGVSAPMTLAPADVRHPIFQAFGAEAASLGLVTFRSAVRIGGPTCQTMAKFTSGDAAIVDCSAGEGHAIVIASDVNNQWNDFPLRASFVPFVHEAVRYLSISSARGGDYVIGELPSGVRPVPGVVDLPSGQGSGARARRVVVNVDARESDPSRISVDEFQAAVSRLKNAAASEARTDAGEQESRQRLWQFLLASMILTLVIEGVIAARSA